MNRDAVGTTSATDAAAPAIAAPAETSPAPARTLDEMEEIGPIDDVVELTEHYETDSELAELALELLNAGLRWPEELENVNPNGDDFIRYAMEIRAAKRARSNATMPT
ncbi:MAG: hypothetical protein HZA61_04620, partial [Candidatus Eisenbacteria bacterium]|nr:hypothetical protein [Candidatus Eisenbacteria bacterium]